MEKKKYLNSETKMHEHIQSPCLNMFKLYCFLIAKKIHQIQLISFFCMSNRNIKKSNKKLILYKYTSPNNEFLFPKCRNNSKIRKCKKKSHMKIFTSPANEFLLHT